MKEGIPTVQPLPLAQVRNLAKAMSRSRGCLFFLLKISEAKMLTGGLGGQGRITETVDPAEVMDQTGNVFKSSPCEFDPSDIEVKILSWACNSFL